MQHEAEQSEGATPPTLLNWQPFQPVVDGVALRERESIDCGWGRLIFGHTFREPEELVAELLNEAPRKRDIALYIRDPHVILSLAPQELFLDPSHTYRLTLSGCEAPAKAAGFTIRPVTNLEEAEGLAAVWQQCQMVPAMPGFVMERLDDPALIYLVALDDASGAVVGGVVGVDHAAAFSDPEEGASLWSLAVDRRSTYAGVGEALVLALAARLAGRGRAYLDLSVMHDNTAAISLYEALGFRRVPVFCIKRKNSINEALFVGESGLQGLNPYGRIIVDEARRRGIAAEPVDPANGYFRLRLGGRAILCRESLSALTPATTLSLCDDKQATRRVLAAAGLKVPDQIEATDPDVAAFLHRHGRVVVKPLRGEQGRGVAVDLSDRAEIADAVERARQYSPQVLIEQFAAGQDLRVVVIGGEVVAAAIRRPAQVCGTGRHSIRRLIEKQSRRRAAATDGESRIPLDDETRRCVAAAGHALDDILPSGVTLTVRKSANLHTGGTIHDVTAELHPALAAAALNAAAALEIPVVGLDFLVPSPDQADYVIIEANERPGLANHEPQPTAQRFIDLLFPETVRQGQSRGRNP